MTLSTITSNGSSSEPTEEKSALENKREKKRLAKALYVKTRICVKLFYCQGLRQLSAR